MTPHRAAASSTALLLALAIPANAESFTHDIHLDLSFGNHPNVVTFIGAVTVGVSFQTDASGNNNPLYEQQTLVATNPLYSGTADPGTIGSIQSIAFELDTTGQTPFLHSQGVIHRDLAARNVLITTNDGTYASATNESILFGNDGPPDVRSNIGPVRWMAPESIRERRTGSTDPNDYIDILTGSYLEVSYVPEPSSLAMLGVGVWTLSRRRR